MKAYEVVNQLVKNLIEEERNEDKTIRWYAITGSLQAYLTVVMTSLQVTNPVLYKIILEIFIPNKGE